VRRCHLRGHVFFVFLENKGARLEACLPLYLYQMFLNSSILALK
jgi:hypothetical protein